MKIKDWIKKHYSGEIEELIEISEATGREASAGFCAHNPKEEATGSMPIYTYITVEGKDEFRGPHVGKSLCRKTSFPVGTAHIHPRATNENVRLSREDRENARENRDVTCVASPEGKVVCEDWRDGKKDEFSFMVEE